MDEELCVRVFGVVLAIHSSRPGCMMRSIAQSKFLEGNNCTLFTNNLRHEMPLASQCEERSPDIACKAR